MILLFMGCVDDAHAAIERAIDAFDASDEADRLTAQVAGQDAGVANLSLMSWALWLLGHVDRAAAQIASALQRADDLQHPHTLAYACYYASVLFALRGEPEIAHGYADQCLSLSEEHGFGHWIGLSRAVRGICAAALDPSAGALRDVPEALNEYCGAGYQLGVTALYALLCRAFLLSGQPDAAFEAVEQGLSAANRNAERMFEAELYRLKAQVLLVQGEPDAESNAQAMLERSLKISRSQRVRSLELRTARDLAERLFDQGSRNEALDLLQPVFDNFTEGFDTQDLVEAKYLLGKLHRENSSVRTNFA